MKLFSYNKELSIKSKWKKPDYFFIGVLMILVTLGIIFVFDTCYSEASSFKNGIFQFVWLGLGVGVFLWFSNLDLRYFKKYSFWYILICLGLMILLQFKGVSVNGAVRWIKLGPITIQPSEFAKLAFVLGLAFMVDVTREFEYPAYNIKKINGFWFYLFGIILVIMLVLIAIGSMSAFISFAILTVIIGFYGNVQNTILGKWLLGLIVLLVLIGAPYLRFHALKLYNMENPTEMQLMESQLEEATMLEVALQKQKEERTEYEEYLVEKFERLNNDKKSEENSNSQKNLSEDKTSKKNKGYLDSFAVSEKKKEIGWRAKRFAAWVNPKKYINDIGLQPAYGLLAISTGGMFGCGIGEGRCKFNIPESHNDYIFPTIIEETGFLGGVILLVLYALLFWRTFVIMEKCDSNYGKLLTCGCLVVLATEVFINLMVALNIIPSTGVCLPFISYGGSSTLMNFMCAGIIIGVSKQIDIPDKLFSNYKIIEKKRGDIKNPTPFRLNMPIIMNKKNKERKYRDFR